MKKRIAILGSTGSIGTQTLDVIAAHPEAFEAVALTAHRNAAALIEQAIRFQPKKVVIGDDTLYEQVRQALSAYPIDVCSGYQAIEEAAALPSADIVVTALSGFSGLLPTLRAIEAGKTIALANKETLVVAGELTIALARKHAAPLIPVDSEHSAIFQCLQGEKLEEVERLILTASGGPFRLLTAEALERVTPQDALRHPSWQMGNMITVNSATMMNKGMEVIEACRLFALPAERIEVLIHPQSVIHSMVAFVDGSVKAQLGAPDMRTPIQYALSYPHRLQAAGKPLIFADYPSLTFENPDTKRFPMLQTAYRALQAGGNMPCIMNAANEKAVTAFLDGKIGFTDICRKVDAAMAQIPFIRQPSIDDLLATHRETISHFKI